MSTRPGIEVTIGYLLHPVAPGDELLGSGGARYHVTTARKLQRWVGGTLVDHWHTKAIVLSPNAPAASEGTKVHRIVWVPRDKTPPVDTAETLF